VRGVFDGYDGSDPVIQLQGHKTNIHGSDAIMGVDDYVDLGEGVTASIYRLDGTQVGTSEESDPAGEVTFTDLAPGTYILKTVPTYYEDEEEYGFENAFFILTGAYSEITIPPAVQ
jgi:uncharacterized surface anchored protein